MVNAKTLHIYLPAEASAQAGERPGKYTIAIRIVDIFSNDATGTIEVTIK